VPSAAVGEVVATELQQSIFNAPPSATTISSLPPPPSAKLNPPSASGDHAMADAKSPAGSVAGQKRRRDEDDEDEEDSEGDVAMEEDSDDE
jgi:U2 small nuclear ribonucleoprotein B''